MQAYDQELSDMQKPRVSATAALVASVFNRPTADVFLYRDNEYCLGSGVGWKVTCHRTKISNWT